MAGKLRFTTGQVINAIAGAGGIKTTIAARLGCNRNTVSRYIERYESVAQVYQEEVAKVGDLCETELINAIKRGNITAIIFYCKTKLKNRGYIEKQEIDAEVKAKVGVLVVPGILSEEEWMQEARGPLLGMSGGYHEAE